MALRERDVPGQRQSKMVADGGHVVFFIAVNFTFYKVYGMKIYTTMSVY